MKNQTIRNRAASIERCLLLCLSVLALGACSTADADVEGDDHAGHDHSSEEGHDDNDDHAGHDHGDEEGHDDDDHAGHDHGDEAGHDGAAADWCAEHGLPESQCTVCNPGLIAEYQAAGDWCGGHGFPESVCPQCNPMAPPDGAGGHAGHDHETEDDHDDGEAGGHDGHDHGPGEGHGSAESDWCGEHGLPESQCTTCSPALVDQYQDAGDWCDEHGFPESVCPTCNPVEPPHGAGREVVLTELAIARSGIQVAPAASSVLADSIEVPAEVHFDPDRMAHVNTLVDGQLVTVAVTLGDRVEADQELATFRSVEIGQARAELHRADAFRDVARSTLERQTRLNDEGISSERSLLDAQLRVEEADAALDAARARLQVFGVRGGRGGDMTLTSPIAGSIIERHATRGENVSSEETLFVVADSSSVWVMGRVYEREAPRVATGMRAALTLGAYPGREWVGSINYVAASLDESTRSLPIRVEIPNTDGALRPGMFGTLELGAPEAHRASVVVPSGAVQSLDNQTVVFLRREPGEFEAVDVTLGRDTGGQAEVLTGLSAGDPLVVEGAFILLSELMRGELADGCGGH